MVSTLRARSLGKLEEYSAVRSHLGMYLNVGLTITYDRDTSEPLEPAIHRALTSVIAKHPSLAAVPRDIETGKPYFELLAQIDLNKAVTFQTLSAGESLDQLLERHHNLPFLIEDAPVPFWRVVVLTDLEDTKRFSICFIFHHALADTRSAIVFHEDLERALSNPEYHEPAALMPLEHHLLPAMESLLHLDVSTEYQRQQQASSTYSSRHWSGGPQSTPVRSCFRSSVLSAETTREFTKVASKERSSVTAVLQNILATSLFEVLPSCYDSLLVDYAVSLRHMVPHPINASSMGVYVGSLSETFSRCPFSFERSRESKARINCVMASKASDMPVGFLRHVPNMLSWFRQKIGRPRASALELSNVGKIDAAGSKSEYRMNRAVFSQSAGATSGAIKVSAITGKDGQMVLGFTWQEGIVHEDVIVNLMRKSSELITSLMRTSFPDS